MNQEERIARLEKQVEVMADYIRQLVNKELFYPEHISPVTVKFNKEKLKGLDSVFSQKTDEKTSDGKKL